MIVSFNIEVFNSHLQQHREALEEIIELIVKSDIHFIDKKGIKEIFYNGSFCFDNHPVGKELKSRDIELLKKHLSKSITQIHKRYLTKVKIGFKKNEIAPNKAVNLFKERSQVIIENRINDWKFLSGVCDKYTSKNDRESIYKLLQKAIRNENIEPHHAGGFGEIKKLFNDLILMPRYSGIAKHKVMVIFDSDKAVENNYQTPHKALVRFFTEERQDEYTWHILHKRKLENYVPLSLLFKEVEIDEDEQQNLLSKTEEELDFIDIERYISLNKSKIKNVFPEIFKTNFSYQLLEERCKHHHMVFELSNKEQIEVSEMEELLLKLVKLI